jgi:hypothetical protein
VAQDEDEVWKMVGLTAGSSSPPPAAEVVVLEEAQVKDRNDEPERGE